MCLCQLDLNAEIMDVNIQIGAARRMAEELCVANVLSQVTTVYSLNSSIHDNRKLSRERRRSEVEANGNERICWLLLPPPPTHTQGNRGGIEGPLGS